MRGLGRAGRVRANPNYAHGVRPPAAARSVRSLPRALLSASVAAVAMQEPPLSLDNVFMVADGLEHLETDDTLGWRGERREDPYRLVDAFASDEEVADTPRRRRQRASPGPRCPPMWKSPTLCSVASRGVTAKQQRQRQRRRRRRCEQVKAKAT